MNISERLSKEERETYYHIDEVENCWIADSSIPKDIRQLERRGWEKIDEQFYADGTVMSARFKAPRKYLSIRQYGDSCYVGKRTLSDEHKAKLLGTKREAKTSQIVNLNTLIEEGDYSSEIIPPTQLNS